MKYRVGKIAKMQTIQSMAYNDIAREMQTNGLELTYAEIGLLGDDKIDWLTKRLGLRAETNCNGVVFRPGKL